MKALALVLLTLGALPAFAAESVQIRLATILPKGTSGHQRLMELKETWAAESGGTVKLTLMPAAESEIQIVQNVRNKRYNAALISAVGLAQIDRSVTCLQLIPMAFRDWREVDFVREKMRGELEAKFRSAGYEVLFWADAGWVRFFSKKEALRPVQLQPMKMFVWTGDQHQMTILRRLGYNPVPLETEFMLSSLMSGTIDVVPVPPFLANATQLTAHAGHMIDLNWAPIVGAAVIARELWERVPAALRPKLLQSAAGVGERIRKLNREEDLAAIAAMDAKNLTVHTPTPEIVAEWRDLVEQVYPQIRGTMVPADLFDRVQGHLADFRAANHAKENP